VIRTFQIAAPVLNGLPGQAVGLPDRGQIVRLFTGQRHGTIRTADVGRSGFTEAI
jgi:hypothetical protein